MAFVAELLKYGGIVLVGVLGVHGIRHDYKDKQTGTLTKPGKAAIAQLDRTERTA